MQKIYLTGEAIRRRLADPDCPDDFPFLDELRAEDVTDYLALPLSFTNGGHGIDPRRRLWARSA